MEILLFSQMLSMDLGILFDSHLKFHDHTSVATAKANCVLGLISKSFEYLDPTMLNRLFKTLVCPILEYGNAIWGPHFILDQQNIEKVQCMQSHSFCLYPQRITLCKTPFFFKSPPPIIAL